MGAKSTKRPAKAAPASPPASAGDGSDDFWSQWPRTTSEDVRRDTYGTDRREKLQHRYR